MRFVGLGPGGDATDRSALKSASKFERFSRHEGRRIKVNEFRNLVVELICRCIGEIGMASAA
jgi:hypothetical protein